MSHPVPEKKNTCNKCGAKGRHYKSTLCRKCETERLKLWKRNHRPKVPPIIIMGGEEWRDCIGFPESYMVSNMGRVKSKGRIDKSGHLRQERLMKASVGDWGYLCLSLFKNGKYTSGPIHILVAKTFIPNPEGKPQVNHKDGDKQNNYSSNLEWVTQKENTQHAVATGLIKQVGEKGFFAKLRNKQACEIYISPKPVKELAIEYNVCQATIYQIKKRRSWKQVTDKIHLNDKK